MDRADNATAVAMASLLGVYLGWALGMPAVGVALFVVAMLSSVAALVAGGLAKQWPLMLLALALMLIALGSPSNGWDARSIWLFHGKRIFVDQSLASQLDGYAHWSQNEYPVFVPVIMASLARLMGGWNELAPKSAMVWTMIPALVIVFARLESVQQRLAMACLVLLCGGTALVNGYMDAVLGVYFVAGACVMLWWLAPGPGQPASTTAPTRAQVLACFPVLVILPLLKNEGLALLACLCAATGLVVLAHRRRLPPWRLVAVCALAVLPLALWKLNVISHGIKSELASSDLSSFFFQRWRNVFFHEYILRTMMLRAEFLVPAALLLLSWRGMRRDAHAQVAVVAAGLYFLIIYLAYLSTPNDLRWHLATSAHRTTVPICMLLSYAAISRLGPAYWQAPRARWFGPRAPV